MPGIAARLTEAVTVDGHTRAACRGLLHPRSDVPGNPPAVEAMTTGQTRQLRLFAGRLAEAA